MGLTPALGILSISVSGKKKKFEYAIKYFYKI